MINIHTMLTGNWRDMNYTYGAGKLLREVLK